MSNLAAGNGQSPANLYVESPTQLASNSDFMSVSESSNSPQTPQTPQLYGRTRPRYPQELGRVPLHRRGTSKTYERLEDLLKEAGYKETRIFTPEAERTATCEDDDDDDVTVVEDKRTSMVRDVVGFLTGLIPGVGASVAGTGAETLRSKILDPSQTRGINNVSQQPSPPPSPLAKKAALPPLSHHEQRQHLVGTHPTQSKRPQIVIHSTAPHHNQAGQHHQYNQGASHHSLHPHQKPHGLGLISGSNIHLAAPHTTTNVHSPRPSRATAYLRHMASAPNVAPKRPNSTPAGLLHSPKSRSRLIVSLNQDDSHEDRRGSEQQPPLPTSWLDMVAKAVLFGGAGAHAGGPIGSLHVTNVEVTRHAPAARQLRPSRSSLSQVSHNSRYYTHHQHRSKKSPLLARLLDSTNLTPSTATSSGTLALTRGPPSAPPALFAQLERGRADRCVNGVSLTRVTCRSAPGSRSGSVVRSEGVGTGVEKNRPRNLELERDVEGEERGRNRGVKRRSGAGGRRNKEKMRVPSLARMHVEGDVWSSNMKTGKRSKPESDVGPGIGKGKAGYASEGEVDESDGYSDETEEDEEEEGELNLARMLLPPKRQNSIRSLQKHLLASVADSGGNSGAHAKLRHAASGRLRRQASHATSVLSQNNADEEEEEDYIDTRRKTGVLPNDGSRNRHQGINGKSDNKKRRNSGSDDEDFDSFAGLFDVGRKRGFGRDPMGSGRSSKSTRSLGIGSVWNVIGGGGS